MMLALLILAALPLSTASPAHAAPTLINGAGATFPYPLYSKWFAEFGKLNPEIQINYQSIGSGGGVRQFLDGTIDFGATDAPMTDEQLGKAKHPVVHVPTALGAVVLTFNLPGIRDLKLTPELVAGVFLGKITKWNDPLLQKENAGVPLPDLAILVAYRSDGSGTTSIFTDYLAKVSPEWKSKVGAGTAVSWPTGLGAKGNEGVTGLIKQSKGALGYVELIYAENNQLAVAQLKNRAGVYVKPTVQAVTAAADAALKRIPADFRVSITDEAGRGTYPLASFTYLIVPQSFKGAPKGKPILKFLRWAITDGQKLAEPLSYARLPKGLVTRIEAKLQSIQVD